MDSNNSSPRLIDIFNCQRQGETWEAMKRLKELTRTRPEKALFHKLLGYFCPYRQKCKIENLIGDFSDGQHPTFPICHFPLFRLRFFPCC